MKEVISFHKKEMRDYRASLFFIYRKGVQERENIQG
ncbi:hypothetical protein PAV_1c06890 [Paenibacillus alvei DSM 29]|nr:hypothetical protein PAV_1c06890 [Paenibacillus alvei DSM 29]